MTTSSKFEPVQQLGVKRREQVVPIARIRSSSGNTKGGKEYGRQ